MDKKLPFIGQIASHVLLVVFSYFFVGRLYAFMFVVILVALLILRLDFWGFTASIVIAIATQLRLDGDIRAFYFFVGGLVFGSTLELGIKIYENRRRPAIRNGFSIGRNTLFAVLGSAIPILFILPVCKDPQALLNLLPPGAADNLRSFLPGYLLRLAGCSLEFVTRPFGLNLQELARLTVGEFVGGQTARGVSAWSILNQFLSFFLLLLVVNPSFWAALFVAIARVGITRPFKAFLWFLGASAVIVFVGFPIAGFLAVAVGIALTATSQLTQSVQPLQLAFVSMITLLIFIPALTAGLVTGIGRAKEESQPSFAV
jgi:hypothetical protein